MKKLYVVGTPIGNLEDITLRAIEVLRSCDLIACEDRRRTSILLHRYGIKKPLLSYHDHNKKAMTPRILARIGEGKKVALVSDAGMPGICDPGFYLIRAAIQAGVEIVPIPGPTALITALIISGLPCDRFVFEGYLHRRRGRRRKQLQALKDEPRSIICYEAPTRLLATLEDILDILGDRMMVITRELTKKFEEVLRGNVSELIEELKARKIRGELTLVIEGKDEE
ncbi:16S rRNA (cytidine(1402)-2'-O)-methyltransferase [candidate division WOR-3 bacterium]|uniref:Ribosomal RNA small subunit methyltransferase I n=1 Tax=candidate division WOR-3 bacterium TaxID=2052148 RepID=A0A660SKU1_UNCW3|nr:MAG: 16S rRNA (cytidine(1402)-2'-O)-methyltransferase [candidate division WOR-3 bacterium]